MLSLQNMPESMVEFLGHLVTPDLDAQIQTLCLSPDGRLLLAIDTDGRSLLINKTRRALLHHFSFKGPVLAAKFSPDGQYIACAVGRLLQVRLRCLLRFPQTSPMIDMG